MIRTIILVGLGSFGGGVARYLLSFWLNSKRNPIPWGTWLVNVLGCLLIGVVLAYFERGKIGHEGRLFLMVGVLGGFTTFSAFSHETVLLLRNGQLVHAASYVLLSVVFGLLATSLGYYMIRG